MGIVDFGNGARGGRVARERKWRLKFSHAPGNDFFGEGNKLTAGVASGVLP
jgi:hypothetical protein